MFSPDQNIIYHQPLMTKKKTRTGLESLKHSLQVKWAIFWFSIPSVYQYTSNLEFWLILCSFVVLAGNSKSIESKSETNISGTITLLGIFKDSKTLFIFILARSVKDFYSLQFSMSKIFLWLIFMYLDWVSAKTSMEQKFLKYHMIP